MSALESTPTIETKKGIDFQPMWDYIKHTSKSAFSLLYIINGVAVGLYAFDFIHPPHVVAAAFGAVSIAFAAVHLATMVNAGVKYQSNTKRRK